MSGSIFDISYVIPSSNFKLTARSSRLSTKEPENIPYSRNFCGECGSTVMFQGVAIGDLKCIRAGLINDMQVLSALKPTVELFTDRLPAWLAPIEGAT